MVRQLTVWRCINKCLVSGAEGIGDEYILNFIKQYPNWQYTTNTYEMRKVGVSEGEWI